MNSNLYYIYIDTKILGAVKQLLSYFHSNVFKTNSCIAVYVKYYKENYQVISKIFEDNNIPYKFIKRYSDISFQDNKVVFYLFNAQSNCRMVSFRNVSHVFITHGESNKKSSVKPIIRIYDYVVASGQMGIDRYLKAAIFSQYDIDNNRVIRLGNTFVGQNNYFYKRGSCTLLYAPTWEGGVIDENFSSISEDSHYFLLKVIRENLIRKVIIQIHPNLGHRDEAYNIYLKKLLNKLRIKGVKVFLVKKSLSVKDRIYGSLSGLRYISSSKKLEVSHAVTDISAMEVQLLVKKIPTVVLAHKYRYEELVIPKKMHDYYSSSMIYLDNDYINSISFPNPEVILNYIESYHDEALRDMTLAKRVEWLCNYVNKERIKCNELLQEL